MKFGLPNEDRPWEEYFVGTEEKERKEAFGTHEAGIRVPFVRDYSEGTDELCLVEGIEVPAAEVVLAPQIKWEETDDVLLRELFIDRGCSISIIASVFKMSDTDIELRLKELGLLSNE